MTNHLRSLWGGVSYIPNTYVCVCVCVRLWFRFLSFVWLYILCGAARSKFFLACLALIAYKLAVFAFLVESKTVFIEFIYLPLRQLLLSFPKLVNYTQRALHDDEEEEEDGEVKEINLPKKKKKIKNRIKLARFKWVSFGYNRVVVLVSDLFNAPALILATITCWTLPNVNQLLSGTTINWPINSFRYCTDCSSCRVDCPLQSVIRNGGKLVARLTGLSSFC